MSERIIQGRNVAFSFDLGTGSKLLICARSFSIEHTTTLIETTSLTTGKYREYEGQSIDWTITIGTVLAIDTDKLGAFDMLAHQLSLKRLSFTATFTDDFGTISTLTGLCIIETNTINGSTADPVGADMTLKGCGKIPELDTVDGEAEPNLSLLTWFYESLEGGETELSRADWIGADIIEVIRNGMNLRIVAEATSNPNEVKVDTITGTITPGLPLTVGEWVQVVYET